MSYNFENIRLVNYYESDIDYYLVHTSKGHYAKETERFFNGSFIDLFTSFSENAQRFDTLEQVEATMKRHYIDSYEVEAVIRRWKKINYKILFKESK